MLITSHDGGMLTESLLIHVNDNCNNEIRGGGVNGVKRDAGGDEKQLIKFAWPNSD